MSPHKEAYINGTPTTLVLHEGFSEVGFRVPLLEQLGWREAQGGRTGCFASALWAVATLGPTQEWKDHHRGRRQQKSFVCVWN